MITKLFALLTAVALAPVAHAEDLGVKLGLQGGINFSSLTPPSGISSSNLTGFSAGLAVDLPLNPTLSIRPEALFSQRGAVIVEGGSGNVSARQNTIEIPVFLKIALGEGVRPNVFAGPMFSFNVGDFLAAEAGGNAGAISFNPKTVDFGLALGAGLDIGPLFINGRYLLGIVDFSENGASWKSRGFELLAGIHL